MQNPGCIRLSRQTAPGSMRVRQEKYAAQVAFKGSPAETHCKNNQAGQLQNFQESADKIQGRYFGIKQK